MQNNLFVNQTDPAAFETHDLGDAWIREYPALLQREEADALLRDLLAQTPWQQDTLWIAGREIPVPRLQCWMGDRGSRYGYSGMRLEPTPWSPAVSELRARVEQVSGFSFNSVLLNQYRDGQDSVSWHADDEAELGPNPVIASLSLGVARHFDVRRNSDGKKYRFSLQHGSMLLMDGGLQRHWQHRVPKQAGIDQARINLTFRTVFHR